jgi:fermentation-respiration switch protein FrsA (DUF1100 family)
MAGGSPAIRFTVTRMSSLKWLVIVALSGYGGLLALMYVAQRALMYFPETAHTSPADADFSDAGEIPLTSSDGVRILAWYVPPRDGHPIVLYFQGNGGAPRHRVPRFAPLVADGTGLLALSYRGYAGAQGSPSENGFIADAGALYDFASSRFPADKLVLWGESIGSGVAVALAAQKPVGAVILEAPFTSAVEVAARRYPFVPARLLMKDQFHSDERIAQVKAPLLVMHGALDGTVPIALGEKLFSLANEPKRFVRFARGGHNDLDDYGALDTAKGFIAEVVK